MTIKEIKKDLGMVGRKDINLSNILQNLKILKRNAVNRGFEMRAKDLWILERIALVNCKYQEAFKLLINRKYFDAWCSIEQVEIMLKSLKRHFDISDDYKLSFIERTIKNLQVLFPYRLFSSSEFLKKKKKCNICNKIVSVRNPCVHKVGEIYSGEECIRIVTELEPLGIAYVENPVNKYGVLFLTKEDSDGNSITVDNYNYELIENFLKMDLLPYSYWDLELIKTYFPHPEYKEVDSCPCLSGLKYIDCCKEKQGIEGFHYEFKMKENHARKIFSRNPVLKNEMEIMNKNSKGRRFFGGK